MLSFRVASGGVVCDSVALGKAVGFFLAGVEDSAFVARGSFCATFWRAVRRGHWPDPRARPGVERRRRW
eukprot:7880958-Lingulodinium_polyedra.AAC.1